MDGWQVVVKKGEFLPGDPCVYVEIDSVLPERPEFEFLRDRGFRIKTIKLGGVLSQGICFPTSIIPLGVVYEDGMDVTDILGITQYIPTMDRDPEPPPEKPKRFLMRFKWYRRLVSRRTQSLSGFPSFVSKTDEVRIQNAPHLLDEQNEKWVFTEKVDGTSATFILLRHKSLFPFVKDQFEFIVCSRNRRLPKMDDSHYWSVARDSGVIAFLRDIINTDPWIAVQGEIIGPKIQGNKYKVKRNHFYAFNLISPAGRMGSIAASEICRSHGISFVPIDHVGELPNTVEEMLAMAHGKSLINPSVLREGLVCRSLDGQKSFKAVDPEFLIKHDE